MTNNFSATGPTETPTATTSVAQTSSTKPSRAGRKVLLELATIVIGALLWIFADDTNVGWFDLGTVGRVLVIIGVIGCIEWLWRSDRSS